MAKDKHLEEVDHTYIRYANVWEDPNLLIEGLGIRSGHKVLSIASAGDNALALLSQDPEVLVAIDLNRGQLYLTELKKVAIAALDQSEYVKFIGFSEDGGRWQTYLSLRDKLSGEARAYWNGKEEDIRDGVIQSGKFEKYLRTFARRVLPFIHKKKTTAKLFEKKPASEQLSFYKHKWDTWLWRALFRIFFNKQVMGLFGRDRAFLKHVQVHVSTTILKKAGEHLSSIYAQRNPILYYCLNGHFGPYLPYYARPENYEKIKANLDALKIEFGYAQDAAVRYGKFDRFNLSNIFEYMDPEVFDVTAQSILDCANPKARFAYWNLMVKREMSSIKNELQSLDDFENWAERDQGFFYMQFVLEKLL